MRILVEQIVLRIADGHHVRFAFGGMNTELEPSPDVGAPKRSAMAESGRGPLRPRHVAFLAQKEMFAFNKTFHDDGKAQRANFMYFKAAKLAR